MRGGFRGTTEQTQDELPKPSEALIAHLQKAMTAEPPFDATTITSVDGAVEYAVRRAYRAGEQHILNILIQLREGDA